MDHTIKNKIIEIVQKYDYNGAVLVSFDKSAIIHVTNGYENIEVQKPISTSTIFRIASLSKQYTATAIIKLVEMNQLSLNDKLSTFIPDFPDGDRITIHHILSSSSGIANFELYGDYSKELNSDYPLLELINIIKKEPLNFNPGERFEYSNSGYLVLTYIIEKITGITFGEFIDQYIFSPTNIKTTYLTLI